MIIVNYHNVVVRSPNAFNKRIRRWVKVKDFERQLAALAERFRIVSLDEIVQAIRRRQTIPAACAITFDDGYLGVYKYAMPALEKHRLPATVFLITSLIKQTDKSAAEYFDRLEALINLTPQTSLDLRDFGYGMVSLADEESKAAFLVKFRNKIKVTSAPEKNQIDERINQELEVSEESLAAYLQHEAYQMMEAAQVDDWLTRGFTVGSHTRTHPSLSQIDNDQVEFEIRGSYQDLQERFGLQEMAFAYPYGEPEHISKAAMAMVQQSGYNCALTMIGGMNTPETDLYQLRRMSCRRAMSNQF